MKPRIGKHLLFTITLLPSVAFADISELNIQDILQNLQTILNPLLRMLLAFSFIAGVWFIIKALLKFKSFAHATNQMTQPGDFSGPVMYMFVGTVLIYIPTSTNVLSATLFGNVPSLFGGGGSPNINNLGKASTQIMGYASVSLESQWATLIDTVVYYMQFIGFLAFLRGWIIMSHATQHQGQQDSFVKGIVHIVGGILAINFLPLVNAVSNTISGGS